MLKIVIVGHHSERLYTVKQELNWLVSSSGDVRVCTSKPNYLEAQIDKTLKVLVIDTETVTKKIFPLVLQIRKKGFQGPIVILGHLSKELKSEDLNEPGKLFFLQKPYEAEQILGVVKNALSADEMKQRRDPRFDVHERAVLEAYSSDFRGETTINNISKSGVRIVGQLKGLKQGDLLRLHFNFQKIQKERVMSARVVWIKENANHSEEAGLEFVSQKSVYQYLLRNASA